MRPDQVQIMRSFVCFGVSPDMIPAIPRGFGRFFCAHVNEFYHMPGLAERVDARGVSYIKMRDGYCAGFTGYWNGVLAVFICQSPVIMRAGYRVRGTDFNRRILRIVHDARKARVVLARASQGGVRILMTILGEGSCVLRRVRCSDKTDAGVRCIQGRVR